MHLHVNIVARVYVCIGLHVCIFTSFYMTFCVILLCTLMLSNCDKSTPHYNKEDELT